MYSGAKSSAASRLGPWKPFPTLWSKAPVLAPPKYSGLGAQQRRIKCSTTVEGAQNINAYDPRIQPVSVMQQLNFVTFCNI